MEMCEYTGLRAIGTGDEAALQILWTHPPMASNRFIALEVVMKYLRRKRKHTMMIVIAMSIQGLATAVVIMMARNRRISCAMRTRIYKQH